LFGIWYNPGMTAPESPVAPPPGSALLGAATIEPATPIVAGDYGTWRLTFRCGARGIAAGGALRIHTDSDTDWGIPQLHDPARAEYLTCAGPAPAAVGLKIVDEKSVVLTVFGSPLRAGDVVTLTIGDRSGGGPGSRAQTFAEARRAFLVDVDVDGAGRWTPILDPPHLAIVGGPVVGLVVVAPSTVRTGEPFSLLVRTVDAWGNPAPSWKGTVTLTGSALALPETQHTFAARDGGVWWLDGCIVAAEGTHRVEARAIGAGDAELIAHSNPMCCKAQPSPYRLYWGDPHGGQIADASKIPDFFRYARDVAGVHFAGYQRNDHVHSNADYALQQQAEREFAAPGRFVPLPGFEWTADPSMGGHHNVYFRRHDQPMRRNSHQGVADLSDLEADLPHVLDLHRAYRGTDTLITPHVGGGHADLTYHEPTLEPALEISSTHGSFEWFLRESLERGYRMGFVGGSDSHDGRPGADSPGYQERRYAKGSLTGLLAEDLTLAGIHEALRARRCYATTGERILLQVTADDHLMGEEFRTGAPPTIAVSVTGTAPLEEVTVFRGLVPVYHHALERNIDRRRLRLLWEGASRQTSYSGVIWDGDLRLRDGVVTLGRIARLRFDSPRSHIVEQSASRLRWHSVTCGYRSGIVVDLPGDGDVEAECVVRTALITRPSYGGHGDRGPTRMSYAPAEAVTFRFSLHGLADRPLCVNLGPVDRRITVSTAPGAGNPHLAQFTFVDRSPRPGTNPYWVRVVQEDQEMAWSSPIFVDYVAPAQP
jgi:hypothetical protein